MDAAAYRPRETNWRPLVARRPSSCMGWLAGVFLSFVLLLFAPTARGAISGLRFDLFTGYDGIVPQGAWFPATFEIANDGPGFTALLEVTPSHFSGNQTRSMVVELPTGTTKRFIIPLHTSATYRPLWNARLLDEKGRVRSEVQSLPPRRLIGGDVPIFGALSRTPPVLPEIKGRTPEMQPAVARFQPLLFPDHPLTLEGLDTLYLGSERALELKQPQVNALLAWLYGGGHLIVGVEQINHLTGPGAWLAQVLPATLNSMTSLNTGPQNELQRWLNSPPGRSDAKSKSSPADYPFSKIAADSAFDAAPLQTATGALRDGRVLFGPDASPLALQARRGRGQITLLTFAPELEPFKSWKNAPYFWARMAGVDLTAETKNQNYQSYTGRSLDGIFGAMIDSKQIRKLPVGWLLVLLLAYLAVIGPIDQYWLKKLNRQMLTWITFPAYVAFFSLLIYFIGYRLRAGESEWNELHVVDIIAHETGPEIADLRGRTFASVYSPVNAKYQLASDQPFATLRGEVSGNAVGGQDAGRANVEQRGNAFHGTISVPVWTSQLYVSDWLRQNPSPLAATITPTEITLDNRLDQKLSHLKLVLDGQIHDLGEILPQATRVIPRAGLPQSTLASYVQKHSSQFIQAIDSRQRAFGNNAHAQIYDITNAAMASSFVSQLNTAGNPYNNYASPPGYDLNLLAQSGDAILLAWASGYSINKPLPAFNPRRTQRDTLLRLTIPGGK